MLRIIFSLFLTIFFFQIQIKKNSKIQKSKNPKYQKYQIYTRDHKIDRKMDHRNQNHEMAEFWPNLPVEITCQILEKLNVWYDFNSAVKIVMTRLTRCKNKNIFSLKKAISEVKYVAKTVLPGNSMAIIKMKRAGLFVLDPDENTADFVRNTENMIICIEQLYNHHHTVVCNFINTLNTLNFSFEDIENEINRHPAKINVVDNDGNNREVVCCFINLDSYIGGNFSQFTYDFLPKFPFRLFPTCWTEKELRFRYHYIEWDDWSFLLAMNSNNKICYKIDENKSVRADCTSFYILRLSVPVHSFFKQDFNPYLFNYQQVSLEIQSVLDTDAMCESQTFLNFNVKELSIILNIKCSCQELVKDGEKTIIASKNFILFRIYGIDFWSGYSKKEESLLTLEQKIPKYFNVKNLVDFNLGTIINNLKNCEKLKFKGIFVNFGDFVCLNNKNVDVKIKFYINNVYFNSILEIFEKDFEKYESAITNLEYKLFDVVMSYDEVKELVNDYSSSLMIYLSISFKCGNPWHVDKLDLEFEFFFW